MNFRHEQKDYMAFRKAYQPMLRGLKREMRTLFQKQLVDTLAATAFTAGHRAGARHTIPPPPVRLNPWKKRL